MYGGLYFFVIFFQTCFKRSFKIFNFTLFCFLDGLQPNGYESETLDARHQKRMSRLPPANKNPPELPYNNQSDAPQDEALNPTCSYAAEHNQDT
jgi:hypothetical protein